MQRLIIKAELPALNAVIDASKRHWANYHVLKRKHTEAIALLAKSGLRRVEDYPVKIKFNWYCRDRRKDPDNIAFAKKFVLDGLVLAGVLKNDSFKSIAELHDCFHVDENNARVEVEILTVNVHIENTERTSLNTCASENDGTHLCHQTRHN
jgi:Holliday junction resolvase RusA-like endonuclease